MPLSTDVLRERISRQQWTSHNIRLNDEVTTCPDVGCPFEGDLRMRSIERIVDFVFGGDWSHLRIADLGSLEGGFALACARKGATVLGVEVRQANFEKLLLLKEHFELPNLTFEKADVKDFTRERFGEFDVVLALGILYHLDEPAKWLKQIAACTRTALVIDTHFAPADKAALARIDPRISALSRMEEVRYGNGIYRGRWFEESPNLKNREGNLWASYSNSRSFWLTKESLLRAVRDAGFHLVLEQHDHSADRYDQLNYVSPRTMLVGLKPRKDNPVRVAS
jgi:hypothetical protein